MCAKRLSANHQRWSTIWSTFHERKVEEDPDVRPDLAEAQINEWCRTVSKYHLHKK